MAAREKRSCSKTLQQGASGTATTNPAAPTSNAPVSPQHSKPSLKKPKLPATASSPSSPSSSSQANVDIRSHRTTRSVSSSPDAEEEEESPLKLTKVAPGTYKWTSDEGASKATKKSVPTFAYDSQDRFTPGSAVLAKFGDTGSWPAVVLDRTTASSSSYTDKITGKRTKDAYLLNDVPCGEEYLWVPSSAVQAITSAPTKPAQKLDRNDKKVYKEGIDIATDSKRFNDWKAGKEGYEQVWREAQDEAEKLEEMREKKKAKKKHSA